MSLVAVSPSLDTNGQRDTIFVAAALLAHVALFALLSLTWGQQAPRAWPKPVPLEVSLVTEVAPEATAPPPPKPPAASVAPDEGQPEAPPPASAPVPPQPKPQPTSEPKPQPKPEPIKPAPAPAKPAPVKPAKPIPSPKPAPVAKPAPPEPAKPQAAAPAKAAPAKPAPASRASRLAGLQQELAAAAKADMAARPRGHRLGDNFLAGLSADAPPQKASAAAPAGKAAAYPTASIQQAIARQIQPCADRQVNPGPGANAIVTTLNLRLNEDGTLAATPHMVRQAGVDGGNERYAQRVIDLGVAAFKGCTPLKLPAEYYQTGNGGWGNINYQWKLR